MMKLRPTAIDKLTLDIFTSVFVKAALMVTTAEGLTTCGDIVEEGPDVGICLSVF